MRFMKKYFCSFISGMLVLFICISTLIANAFAISEQSMYSESNVRSSGTIYESENNNTYSSADRTFNDYDNYGAISSLYDHDYWVVSFSSSGYANFWLGNVPSGCDYDLAVYSSNGSTLLAGSFNSGIAQELVAYPVTAGTNYYVEIYSCSGSSSSQYIFRTKVYPAVETDRLFSDYSESSLYRSYLQYRMNCYGYALHLYSFTTGSQSDPYLQQPGEFARDGESFSILEDCYDEFVNDPLISGTDFLDYLERKIYADFDSLRTNCGSEWTITQTTQNATVPSNCRKIALSIRLINDHEDFHFYFRHDNGKWSHKMSYDPISDRSISTNVIITDNNIASVATEGGYSAGVRYYLIGKSAIVDYPHGNGHFPPTIAYTPTYFLDCAGDCITKSTTITGTSKSARFDNPNDIDFFKFTPTTSGTYTFTTSLTSSTHDVDIRIYDGKGDLIASDVTVGSPNLSVKLFANASYYIEVHDGKKNTVMYTLYYHL